MSKKKTRKDENTKDQRKKGGTEKKSKKRDENVDENVDVQAARYADRVRELYGLYAPLVTAAEYVGVGTDGRHYVRITVTEASPESASEVVVVNGRLSDEFGVRFRHHPDIMVTLEEPRGPINCPACGTTWGNCRDVRLHSRDKLRPLD